MNLKLQYHLEAHAAPIKIEGSTAKFKKSPKKRKKEP